MPTPTPEQQAIDFKLETLHGDINEIKLALGKLSDAIVKLALIEERQTVASAALERAFAALERVENRLSALEQTKVDSVRTSSWVDKTVTAGVGIVILLVLKKTGMV